MKPIRLGFTKCAKRTIPTYSSSLKKSRGIRSLTRAAGQHPWLPCFRKISWQALHRNWPDAENDWTGQEKNIPHSEFIVGDCENLPFSENSFNAIICANSFHHYPNPQNFFNSVQKVLKLGGRLILRDYTAGTFVLWLCNHIEIPLAHLVGHGDVAMRSEAEIRKYCAKAKLTVERFERRKGMRMHCIVRKKR